MMTYLHLSDAPDADLELADHRVIGRLQEWAESLEPELKYTATLCRDGEVTDTIGLSAELEVALEEFPPEDESVRFLVRRMLKYLGNGDENEIAAITD
jgi:hypothetical protein